jgi:hypothetical protein
VRGEGKVRREARWREEEQSKNGEKAKKSKIVEGNARESKTVRDKVKGSKGGDKVEREVIGGGSNAGARIRWRG